MFHRAIMALALGSLVACTAQREPEPKFVPASRAMTANERLPPQANLTQSERDLSALTNARCDRETHCARVGDGRKYDDRAQCVAMLDKAGYPDLDQDHCALGIDQSKLGECLSSIKAEACSSSLARIDDLPTCLDSYLCVK